jgi:hypothetical protein
MRVGRVDGVPSGGLSGYLQHELVDLCARRVSGSTPVGVAWREDIELC